MTPAGSTAYQTVWTEHSPDLEKPASVPPAPAIVMEVSKPEMSTDRKAPDISGAFGAAALGPGSRVAEIKREMEAWRKQNHGRDFGREM
jgi:hypothetical protein